MDTIKLDSPFHGRHLDETSTCCGQNCDILFENVQSTHHMSHVTSKHGYDCVILMLNAKKWEHRNVDDISFMFIQ